MRRFLIRLGLAELSNSKLLERAQTIAGAMNGNLSYPSPVNPTLVELGVMITDFSDATTAYGSASNHGSTAQLAAVTTTRAALEDGLTSLSYYCENTTPYDRDAFLSGGWEVKREKSPTVILQAVVFLHQFISRDVNYGEVKLKWSKPLDTSGDVINAYNVFRSTTASFNSAAFVATVSKTSFIDSGLTQPFYFYWVVPIGAAGPGVTSDMCFATVALQP